MAFSLMLVGTLGTIFGLRRARESWEVLVICCVIAKSGHNLIVRTH